MAEPFDGMRRRFEPAATYARMPLNEAAAVSIAISLKRIADAMGEGSPFLTALGGTLDDASHNHQQRMRNI